MTILDLPGSVTKNRIFLHLDNEICRSEHLCRSTVLHYNVYLYLFTFIKQGLCNLDIASQF